MKGPEYRVPLPGSERMALPGFRALHRVNPSDVISCCVVLRPRSEDEIHRLVAEMASRPPKRRHYLTREQYAQSHGADPENTRKVVEFGESHGLRVVEVDKASSTVRLRGTAEAIKRAFGVELFVYQRDQPGGSQCYRGRTGPIYIPAQLEGIVQAVLGLDNRPQARSK